MQKIKALLMLGFLGLTACQTSIDATMATVPSEVKQLVQKRQTCLQLQLKHANQKSVALPEVSYLQGCDNITLAREFRQLREKYQHNRKATELLDSYADFD